EAGRSIAISSTGTGNFPVLPSVHRSEVNGGMTGAGRHPGAEQFSDYVDGRLDAASRGAIRAHLEECPGCADDAAALWRTVELVRQLPPLPPPRDFRVGPRPAAPAVPNLALRLYPWTRWAAAAAAA